MPRVRPGRPLAGGVKRTSGRAQNQEVQQHLAGFNNELGSPGSGVMGKRPREAATDPEEGWTVVKQVQRQRRALVPAGAPVKRRKVWVVKCDHNERVERAQPCTAPLRQVSPALTFAQVLMSNVRCEGGGRKRALFQPVADGSELVINPAFRESYRGCADMLTALSNNQLPLVKRSVAERLQKVMDLHRDQQDVCCTARSLLAFCRCDEELRYVEELDWNGYTQGQFETKIAPDFAKIKNRPLDLRYLNQEAKFEVRAQRKDRKSVV